MAEIAALAPGSAPREPQQASTLAISPLPTGASAAIRRVNQLIGQVALFDSTVLVLGESGTGKELVARAIHEASARRRRAFVPINCGAIPSELLESELFGHEKGAFTGALAARKGRFEIAEGGTIFLDEIGDMNPTMQIKLLRVLQERVFERVGSCVSQRCSVRVIAATHRNLEEAIARGGFREDLYYRLNVVPIEMPPLRERIDDLPLLIAALVEQLAIAGQPRVQFGAPALAALARYRWPGNVRELSNLIERMSVQHGSRLIGVADLPQRYRPTNWDASAPAMQMRIASLPAPTLLVPAVVPIRGERGPDHLAGESTPLGFDPATGSEAAVTVAPTHFTALPARPDSCPSTLPAPVAPTADTMGAADAAAVPTAAASTAADTEPELIDEPVAMHPAFADALLAALPPGFDLREHLESLERQLIMRALQSAGGTVAQAARLLGLRRTTLVEKLRKYALGGAEEPPAES